MPVTDALIVGFIVFAFAIFAGVLAWSERTTRNLARLPQQAQAADQRRIHAVQTAEAKTASGKELVG